MKAERLRLGWSKAKPVTKLRGTMRLRVSDMMLGIGVLNSKESKLYVPLRDSTLKKGSWTLKGVLSNNPFKIS